jgi:cytochrome c oxidase subunit 2
MTVPSLLHTMITLSGAVFGQATGAPAAPAPASTGGAAAGGGAALGVPDYTGKLGPGVWFPESASTVAPGIDLVFDIITWICIVFFVLICIIMAWFCWRYNKTRAPKATSDVTHNTPLELTWTIIPLILVIAIFYVGLQGYLNLRVPPVGTYDVRVTAQKWSWLFEHPNGAGEATTLCVPVGKPVRLLMQSQDVLHACFIPAFRVKQDIVPGRITTLWFEATKVGEFDLFCAEYCGKDHSLMRAKVLVLPEAAFKTRMQDVADEDKRLPDAELAAYAMAKLYPRCASCHSLDGKTGTGPTWRGLWDKVSKGEEMFTDGTKLADLMGPGKEYSTAEDYLRDSILNPAHHVVMNYTNAMPTFKGQLDDRKIWALVLAIRNLDQFDNAGKLKADAAINSAPPASGGFPGSNPDGSATSVPAAPTATPPSTPPVAPPATPPPH